ncbi:MAG TPA: hypothetical protein DDW28_10840 [Prevotella sp.]|nr:hypothetical protein [uncultured Prevotella sp.]HBF06538.1 hypothetical protein [Candidatus Segatella violae]
MKEDSWKIRVNIDGDTLHLKASLNGKQIDVTNKTSACNIAGLSSKVSAKIVAHFNQVEINKE